MSLLAFVIWILGWPILFSQDGIEKHKDEYPFVCMAIFIVELIIWVAVARLIYVKI